MKRAKNDPRPWCACGKKRLANTEAVEVDRIGARLLVHSFPECSTHRVEVSKARP